MQEIINHRLELYNLCRDGIASLLKDENMQFIYNLVLSKPVQDQEFLDTIKFLKIVLGDN